jgi:hypothetical protein
MDGRATAADAPGSGADQREYLGEERRQRHLQIIWAGADVGGLFAANVRSFANNLGPGPPSFATNLGRKLRCLWVGPRMFVGCYTYSSPIQVVEFLNILPRINKIKFPNFGTGSVQLLQ